MTTLFNGFITDGVSYFIENGAITFSEKIERIGTSQELFPFPGKRVDIGGRIVMPGLVNAHHHLYSSLAVGIPQSGPTENLKEILENLWWKLDKLLDRDAIRLSAAVGIFDSVKHGATTIFDHHASMDCITGSLNIIEQEFKFADIKGVLCFETSDRSGKKATQKQIEENLDFNKKHISESNVRGMFGLHANFTLSDETLERVAEVKPIQMPIHIHCGESEDDFSSCRKRGFEGPIERLKSYGLINEHSILAHCIYLSDEDYKIIDKIKPFVAVNCESNLNNKVGAFDREKLNGYVLGTDGMSGDLIASLRAHYLNGWEQRESFEDLRKMFFDRRYELQRAFFPNTGSLEPGSDADLVVLDYIPPTPISKENIIQHLIFGAKSANALITVANGRFIYDAGRRAYVSEQGLYRESNKIAKTLFEKFVK
jgi:putative selenium metabolism protein SsnA